MTRRSLVAGAVAGLLLLAAGPAWPDDAGAARPEVYSARQVAAAMTVTFDMPNFLPLSPLFLGGAGRAVGELSQSPPQRARGAALDFGDVIPTGPALVELAGGVWPEPVPRDYATWWMATSAWPGRPTEDTKAPVAGGKGEPLAARNLYGHAESREQDVKSETSFESFEMLPNTMPKAVLAQYGTFLTDLRSRLAAVPGVSPAALPVADGAVVRVSHATSSQAAGWTENTLGGTGQTVLQGVELLGGAVKIDQIVAGSKGSSTRDKGDGEATGTITGVTLAGQPVTVGHNGIKVNDTPLGEGSGDQIVKAFNDALASNGFSLVFDQSKKADSAAGNNVDVGWTGVTFSQTVADFPPGFSTVYSVNLGAASTALFRNDAPLPVFDTPGLGIGTESGSPSMDAPAGNAGDPVAAPAPSFAAGSADSGFSAGGAGNSSSGSAAGVSFDGGSFDGGSAAASSSFAGTSDSLLGSSASTASPAASGSVASTGTVTLGGPGSAVPVNGELAGAVGVTNFADGTLRWAALAAFGLVFGLFAVTSVVRRLVSG